MTEETGGDFYTSTLRELSIRLRLAMDVSHWHNVVKISEAMNNLEQALLSNQETAQEAPQETEE